MDQSSSSCYSAPMAESGLPTSALLGPFSGEYSASPNTSLSCSPIPPKMRSLKSHCSPTARAAVGGFALPSGSSSQIPAYRFGPCETVSGSGLSMPREIPLEALLPKLSGSFLEEACDAELGIYGKQSFLSVTDEHQSRSSSAFSG